MPPQTQRIVEVPPFVDPGFPWPPATLDLSRGTEYLGEVSGVGWHGSDGLTYLPPECDAAMVDGLLDVEMLMTEGPEPTLTVTAGGMSVLYLPGPEVASGCD